MKENESSYCVFLFLGKIRCFLEPDLQYFQMYNNKVPSVGCGGELGLVDECRGNESGRVVALDCEMVGGGSDGNLDLCARVCLVDEDENLVFHSYVKTEIPVTDFRYLKAYLSCIYVVASFRHICLSRFYYSLLQFLLSTSEYSRILLQL